jgi:hypothetical protein
MPFLQMPDGRYFKYGDDVTFDEAAELSRKQFPKAWGEEKGGVSGALSKGLESLTSSLTTATEAGLGDANAAAKRALKRQKAAGEVYADETGLDKLQKRWDEEGLGGAFKEVMRQTPLVIAEQFPNLGASLASARLGAMAGGAFGGAPGALIGGAAGAFLPSAAQQFGANIERQAYEQEQRGEPININTRDAAKSAAFQGAVDVGGTGAALGKKLVNRILGQDVFKLVKEGATDEAQRLALSKVANESFLPSLKGKKFGAAVKGAGKGILFEDLTEVGQQMLERAQAGLDLFSDDAYAEYADTAFQTTLMAGPLGTMGAYANRSGAKKQLQQLDRIKAANEQAAEDERRATPEYGIGLAEQRLDLHDQLNALNGEVAAAGKGLDKEQKAAFDERRADLEQRINDLDEEINNREDKDQIYGHAQYVQQQRAAQAAGEATQMGFPGMYLQKKAAAEAEQAAPEITSLAEAQMRAPAVLDMLNIVVEKLNAAIASGDTDTANTLMPKYRELVDYYNRLEGVIQNAPKVDDLEAALKKQVNAYRKAIAPDVGDVDTAEKALAKIQEIQQQIAAAKAAQDMFTAEGAVSPEILRQNEAAAQKQALAEQYGQQQQDLFAQTEGEALGQPYTPVSEGEQQQLLSALLAQQGQPELTPEGLPKPQAATFMEGRTDVKVADIPVRTVDPVTGNVTFRTITRQPQPGGAYGLAKQQEEMGPQPSAEKPRPRTQAEIRAANREAARISGEELEAEERTDALMQKLAEQQPEGKGDFANLLPTMRGTGAKFDPLLGRDEKTRKMLDQFGFTKLVEMAGERDLLPKDYVEFATKSDKYVTSALNGFEKTLDELGETDWSKVSTEERAARYRSAYAKSRNIIDSIMRGVEATRLADGHAGLTNRQVFELHTKLREMFDAALENQSMRPDFRKNLAKLKLKYRKPETKVLKGAERPEKQAPKFRLEGQEAEEKAPRDERIVEMERLDRMTRDLKNELYNAQKAGDKKAIADINKQLAAVVAQRKTLGTPAPAISAARNKLTGMQKLLSAAEFAAAEKGKVTTPAVEKAKIKVQEAQAELDKVMAPPAAEEAPEEKPLHPSQKGYQFKLFKDDATYLRRQLAALAKREAAVDKEIGELMRVALAKREKEINTAIAELEAAYNEDKATYDEALAHAMGVMSDVMQTKYLAKPEEAVQEATDVLLSALNTRRKLRKEIFKDKKIEPHLASFLQAFGGRTRVGQRKGPKFALSREQNQALKERLGNIQDVEDDAFAAKTLPAFYKAYDRLAQMESDLHQAALSGDMAFSDVIGLTEDQVLRFQLTAEENAALKEADEIVLAAEDNLETANKALDKVHEKLNMAARKQQVLNRRNFQSMRARLNKIQKQIEAATASLQIPSPDKERLRRENEQRRTETSVAMAKVQEASEAALKAARETEQRRLEKQKETRTRGRQIIQDYAIDPYTGKPVYKTSGSYVTEVFDLQTRTWKKAYDKAPALRPLNYGAAKIEETPEERRTLREMDKLYGVAEESREEQTKVDKKLGRITPQQLAENYMAMQKTYENFADAMPDSFRKDLEKAIQTYRGILSTYNVDAMAFIDAQSTYRKRLAPLRVGKVREATEVDMTKAALERMLTDNAGKITGKQAVQGVTAMLEAFRDSKSFDKIRARFKSMQGERTSVSDSHFTQYAFERPAEDTSKYDVIPEDDQFNFSEQTISGVNFAEGKTSMNTSTGMKGALLNYFHSPAEFDKHVTVFQTVEEAKKDATGAKALSQASNPYRVQAFTDKDGHVYMIADAVVPGQELAVFLHEVGVHAGMERLIGAENMAILSSQINQWSKLGENTLEGSIARKAVERADKSSSANKTEERIAYFVEEAVKAGIDPIAVQKTGSPFAQWFRTLIAAMKSALRKIGLARFEDLTAQNIVDLAYGAAKLKMTGRWHGTAADFRRFNHAFMGTGEGAQAFGWGTYLAERVGIAKGYWSRDVQEKNARRQIQIAGKEPQVFLQDLADSRKISTKGMALDQIDHYITSASRPRILASPKYTPASVKAGITEYLELDIATTEEIFAESAKTPFDVEFYKKSIDATTNLLEAVKALDESEFTISSPKAGKAVGALMYIDTAIHDNEYMDNDAYLRDQPEILAKIKTGIPKGMLNAVETMKNDSIDALTGREIYTALEQLLTDVDVEQADKKISEALDGIGVKGLKFADAFSRDTSSARRKLAKFEKRLADVDAAIAAGKPYTAPPSFIKARLRGALPDKQGKTYTGEELLEHRDTLKAAVDAARAAVSPITRNYIVFNDKNIVRVMSEMGAKQEEIKFSESSILDMMKPNSGKFNSEFEAKYPGMSSFGDRLIAKDKGVVERVAANSTGLRLAIQFVDRFAGLQRIARTMKDKLGGFQMMYWLRAFDQRNNLTAQAASVGVPYMREEVRADGKKEWTLDTSKDSSNLHDIVQEVGKAIPDIGDANATMRMFSLYRMAKRVMRLNREGKDGIAIALGRNISSAERAEAMKQFKAALDFGNSNAHFKAADEMYTRYNRALINFLAQSGAISKEQAATLNKGGDYIGFYREKDGFIVDGEHNITMGDLTTQPYLKELLGGDTAIVDFRTSSLQNTSLIISMALNNFATRNTAVTLTQLGLAKARSSKGPAADNVVRYKVHGEDWHIVVDQDKVQSQFDIPADLLVKGMRGVSTTLPAVVRMMQGPANLLRKGVTRMPTYMVRQLVRDSLNASIAGGLDGNPLTKTLDHFIHASESEAVKRIQSQGFGGGQLFSGTPNDIKRLMTDIMAGTNSWDTAMAWLDKMSHNADTATRGAAYESFIKQGMSDMEASLACLEMTNFSKRGVSPSMAHMATMIPFFNAQIQGLNALWQAYKGTGIASERLNLKNKLIKRGTFMMAMSVMYALAMKDDEAYIKEDMDTKLSNWIFYPPGFDFSIKMPIPFEVGMVFKAIPEALINMANNDKVDRDVLDALGKMALGSVPGGSSFFIPQAAKPAIEVLTGKNLFDFSITEGRLGDIESARLKGLEPGERTNAGTSSIASALGGFLNVSPVKIDHLIRGYGGSMGAFLASAVGTIPDVLGKAKPPAPESKMSQIPLIGGLFGDKDGRALIERAYNNMEDIQQAHGTWKKLVDEGRTKEADEYAKRKANMINANSLAGQFRQKMGDLAAAKRAIAADPSMNPKEKRSAIKEIEAQENELAKQLNSI